MDVLILRSAQPDEVTGSPGLVDELVRRSARPDEVTRAAGWGVDPARPLIRTDNLIRSSIWGKDVVRVDVARTLGRRDGIVLLSGQRGEGAWSCDLAWPLIRTDDLIWSWGQGEDVTRALG